MCCSGAKLGSVGGPCGQSSPDSAGLSGRPGPECPSSTWPRSWSSTACLLEVEPASPHPVPWRVTVGPGRLARRRLGRLRGVLRAWLLAPSLESLCPLGRSFSLDKQGPVCSEGWGCGAWELVCQCRRAPPSACGHGDSKPLGLWPPWPPKAALVGSCSLCFCVEENRQASRGLCAL